MTETDPFAHITVRQNDFSGAYIGAICAVSDCDIIKAGMSLDHDKVDYTISSNVRGSLKSKPKIDVQAKCRMREDPDAPLSYPLDIETYNNLRDPLLSNPRILVVVYVPADIAKWTSQSPTELILRYSAYWLSLKGHPEVPNRTKKTVLLPPENMFTPSALMSMMRNTGEGVDLS